MEKYLRLLSGHRDWKKLKRKLLIGFGIFSLLFVVGAAGLGYGLYKLFGAGTQAVERVLSEAEPGSPETQLEGSDHLAVRLLDGFLAAAIRQGDTATVTDGLLCIEAVGGPSPETTLELITRRSQDSLTAAEAERLLAEVRGESEDKRSRTDACFNLLLS